MIIGINATSGVLQYGYCNDQELFLKFISQSKKIETLPNLISDLIDQSNHQPTKIITITGPGSYTGIRVSLTVAKMISKVYKIELFGFSLFEAYMMTHSNMINQLTVLTSNSRKGSVNLQLFQSNQSEYQAISTIRQLTIQQLSKFIGKFEVPINWHHLNGPIKEQNILKKRPLNVEFPFQQFIQLLNQHDNYSNSNESLIYSSTVF